MSYENINKGIIIKFKDGKQKYSINQVKKAGKELVINKEDDISLSILSYWRACHAVSLDKAYNILKEYAPKIDKHALLAKRLKRTPSIIKKLKRFNSNGMQLSTMQDIGGCRVIVSNIKKADRLVKLLVQKKYFILRNDYISNPKFDGYRSIHLMGKFINEKNKTKPIELQIRTKIQHSWATAVEIVDLFTNQSIKTNSGDKNWSEFFKYTSKQFSILEKNPFLYSSNLQSLYASFNKEITNNKSKEIYYSAYKVFFLSNKLSIVKKFAAFTESIRITTEHIEKISIDGYVLVSIDEIDDNSFQINSEFFPKEKFNLATEKYLDKEKQSLSVNNFVTALVSTTAIGGIKEAYPNYFADSTQFIKYLRIINSSYIQFNPFIFQILNRVRYLFR